MKNIQVDLTEPKCWPEHDIYFKAGVSILHEKLNADGIRRAYYFLHLDGYTLRNFLLDLPLATDRKIVIISSLRLLPVAHYFMANYHNVCAVFDSKTKIETLVKMLKTPLSHKGNSNVIEHSPKITCKDIIILRHYLTAGNMDYIQRRYSRSYTTVQQWKSKLACKLSIRKLEYLILRSYVNRRTFPRDYATACWRRFILLSTRCQAWTGARC